MKADFSRDSFDPAKHYSRVLQQQGRVMLDADANEQSQIQQYQLRTLARDLIGAYGAPADARGFFLSDSGRNGGGAGAGTPDLNIAPGRMYVGGMLLENEDRPSASYYEQPDFSAAETDALARAWRENGAAFLYLEVSERLVTPLDDEKMRESALPGIDTCYRSKLVWRVKSLWLEQNPAALAEQLRDRYQTQQLLQALRARTQKYAQRADLAEHPEFTVYLPGEEHVPPYEWRRAAQESEQQQRQVEERLKAAGPCQQALARLQPESSVQMRAQLADPGQDNSPCLIAPDAGYRGAENHLYRIEIHAVNQDGMPLSWKWSRDNGSICVAALGMDDSMNPGPDMHAVKVDSSRGFAAGDWVELLDAQMEADSAPGPMLRVVRAEPGSLVLEQWSEEALALLASGLRPRLRRWDQRGSQQQPLQGGVLAFPENSDWLDVEDGLQVSFSAGPCRAGDYWQIPLRVGEKILQAWPRNSDDNPESLAPHGVKLSFAPLGFAIRNPQGNGWNPQWLNFCYRVFEPASATLPLPAPAPGQPFPFPSGAPGA